MSPRGYQRCLWLRRSPLFALAAVLVLTQVLSVQAQEPAPPPGYKCGTVNQIPVADQCKFVREECSGDSRIPYAVWYYCYAAPAGTAAKLFFVLAMVAALPLFFCLLGDTAEVYFSPIMAHVSQSIPKMRPRFAGVTFVAMGNGAPDLSANISAIRNGEVLMSAGALTGAAMFVQCIVASEVVRIAGGVSCRGATQRDVAIYLVSVVGVLAAFHAGTVNRWFVAGCVVMYIIYVVWVFCGDEWHARGRPRPKFSWQALRQALGQGDQSVLEEEAARQGLLPWAAVDADEQDLERDSGRDILSSFSTLPGGRASQYHSFSNAPSFTNGGSHSVLSATLRTGSGLQRAALARHSHRLDAKTYQKAVWADLSDELGEALPLFATRGQTLPLAAGLGELTTASLRPAALRHSIEAKGWMPLEWRTRVPWLPGGHATDCPGAPPPACDPEQQLEARVAGAYTPPAALEEGLETSPSVPYTPYSPHRDCELTANRSMSLPTPEDLLGSTALGQGGGAAVNGSAVPEEAEARGLAGWWGTVQRELTIGTCSEWEDYSPSRRRFRVATFPPLLPVYIALRCTIPYVDPAGYSQPWLVVTMLCAPLGVLVYFDAAANLYALATALTIGILGAITIHALTQDDVDTLPPFDFGTSFDFGPAFFSLLGFFMGVLWIDTLASEVVGMLSLIASLCKIPSALMGLSLLAVGNSLGDFFGNMALAKRGASTTALTACVASPLFNMLLSLALGFSAYFAKHNVHELQVALPGEVAVGGVFLIIYNVSLVVVGFFNRGRLPARWYLFARSWYCLYLACAIAFGIVGALQGVVAGFGLQ